MKRQYIAIVSGAHQTSGPKNTIAEATDWATKHLQNTAKQDEVVICETIATVKKAVPAVIVTDIPKDDFNANHLKPHDIQPTKSPALFAAEH